MPDSLDRALKMLDEAQHIEKNAKYATCHRIGAPGRKSSFNRAMADAAAMRVQAKAMAARVHAQK